MFWFPLVSLISPPYWTKAEYLALVASGDLDLYRGLGNMNIKPRVRVKMGRFDDNR